MAATNSFEDAHAEDLDGSHPGTPSQQGAAAGQNKYVALAGIFEDDPFIDEFEAFLTAERQRERDEATAQADLEDAVKVAVAAQAG